MKAKLFLAGVAMSALSSAAMAQTTPTSVDGVINFQGTILSDTCKVSSLNGDAGTINVDMGKIAADDIGTVAAPKRLTSGAGSANIDVVCKTGAKVSMKFAGKAADLSADKKTLRVNSGNTAAGFAQGVGIAVYEGRMFAPSSDRCSRARLAAGWLVANLVLFSVVEAWSAGIGKFL
ncbi:fimbrial protein [Ralstonia mannitolilytica]|uniref:fimbrial protein n=1 Tax=Ralstonia mannitolilytica TaxID=105219 RepID=UPI0028F4DF31|nr:fimbrial protein [Ralstonia mannitolilytica]CAJ0709596.1 hypothetical protein LMG8323_00702 [Ralstonia mannitolilytica]